MSMYDVIVDVFLHPFMGESAIIYMVFQTIVLLTTHLLRKKGIVAFDTPPVHYILGLIIGHLVYVVTVALILTHANLTFF